MANPDSTDHKSQLRNAMRHLPHGNPPASRKVCDALERWLENQPGSQTIAVFAALPGEVDLSEWIARHPERCWVYPRVAGDQLTFHAVEKSASQLVPGPFGIREPSPDSAATDVKRIDTFLCPGLAFDARGGRLGRGGGFYDRMLAGARPDAMKIGVCFTNQIVSDTFQEPHDMRMDLVVSG